MFHLVNERGDLFFQSKHNQPHANESCDFTTLLAIKQDYKEREENELFVEEIYTSQKKSFRKN